MASSIHSTLLDSDAAEKETPPQPVLSQSKRPELIVVHVDVHAEQKPQPALSQCNESKLAVVQLPPAVVEVDEEPQPAPSPSNESEWAVVQLPPVVAQDEEEPEPAVSNDVQDDMGDHIYECIPDLEEQNPLLTPDTPDSDWDDSDCDESDVEDPYLITDADREEQERTKIKTTIDFVVDEVSFDDREKQIRNKIALVVDREKQIRNKIALVVDEVSFDMSLKYLEKTKPTRCSNRALALIACVGLIVIGVCTWILVMEKTES